jgi:hypothetical protein
MFCNFYFLKITKLQLTLQPLKLDKKCGQIWNPLNCFDSLHLKTIKFYSVKFNTMTA